MVRPPQPPVYMFVIDVSQPAVASGMLHVAAETIKACLDDLPGEERTMVCKVLFGTKQYSAYNEAHESHASDRLEKSIMR